MERASSPEGQGANFSNKPEMIPGENPLVTVYRWVQKKEPTGLTGLEIAKVVIEVLDSPDWIGRELAIECGEVIMNMRGVSGSDYDKKAEELIRMFEGGIAQKIFPEELGQIDEVHMAQWEHAYLKWQQEKAK